jgi:hypothetical protein
MHTPVSPPDSNVTTLSMMMRVVAVLVRCWWTMQHKRAKLQSSAADDLVHFPACVIIMPSMFDLRASRH